MARHKILNKFIAANSGIAEIRFGPKRKKQHNTQFTPSSVVCASFIKVKEDLLVDANVLFTVRFE